MKTNRGSALLLTTILMFVILSMVVSLTYVTVMEQKMSQKTKSSVGAFYGAESGVEWALNKIASSNLSATVAASFSTAWNEAGDTAICTFGDCSVYLLKADGRVITTGSTLISEIKAVRSIGTQGSETQRAIEAAVPIRLVGPDGLTYRTVLGADGKYWLDRNLGATQVATAYDDSASYGYLYQWGRDFDGHQIPTSSITTTVSPTDTPGHANFISVLVSPWDWRSPQNDNLWQGAGGINNPCPEGFRLPTQSEWATLVAAANITGRNTAFSSSLKLPAAGGRTGNGGALGGAGLNGLYWSSSLQSTYKEPLRMFFSYFPNQVFVDEVSNQSRGLRAAGGSVRCIKD
jgi:uncharacterized protein (TIGR02145 family)